MEGAEFAMNHDEIDGQKIQQLQELASVQEKLKGRTDTTLVTPATFGDMIVGLFKIALTLAWWGFLISTFFSAPGWAILFLFIIIFFIMNK